MEQKEAVSAIGEDMFSIALDQPFRFPASFTFVLRAFTTLEGLGRTLDPDYRFAAVAQPYALKLLKLQVPCPKNTALVVSLFQHGMMGDNDDSAQHPCAAAAAGVAITTGWKKAPQILLLVSG